MGCAAAWQLSQRGLSVRVLERSVPGAEASSAAAGILGAQTESHGPGPLFTLALKSRARYPEWALALQAQTGIDIEHRVCGVARLGFLPTDVRKAQREFAFQTKQGCRVERLDARAVLGRLPQVSQQASGGVFFPDDARVDPPRLLSALRVAAELSGAVFQSGAWVRKLVVERGRASGVLLDDGAKLGARHVIVAAGSWSSLVEGVPLPKGGVTPARGQIVELGLPVPAFSSVLFGPGCYLVPRDDGRVLVGSTLEFVGFRREVTASAVHQLLGAAIALVPALAAATLRGSWSNFRPYTSDQLPIIGHSAIPGLLLATGHYRNGILLAPITADILVSLVLDEPLPVPVTQLSPGRKISGKSRPG